MIQKLTQKIERRENSTNFLTQLIDLFKQKDTYYLYLKKTNFRDKERIQNYYEKKELIQQIFPFKNNLINESLFQIIENQSYSIKDILNDKRNVNWKEYFKKGKCLKI